ncbi:HNH endonuclease [Corynebacterium matruchotii]|uniref:HNH endonuclease domain protein n=1 Tax=Corynebacterium matruchotii ATCC 33806 TaxID=566549 RepID=C0E248_9CORY|nr:HNH endonuclease domain protein [Corynebacterium matruchotii ATCC 33806]
MAWRNGASRTTAAEWKRLHRLAKQRLPYRCAQCGAEPVTGRGGLELDHVVPVAEGGTDGFDNLQWLCASCHAEKSRREAKRGISRRVARRRRYDRFATRHPGLK